MRTYWALPFFLWCCVCTYNVPLVLCSTAPEFFRQRDTGVQKRAISIPSSVLGQIRCSQWEWGHSFLLMLRAIFQMFSCLSLASSPTWMLHRSLPQPWEIPWATACPSVTVWFVQLHPSAAVTEVWLRSSNGPVATRSLLGQAGTSSGLGKPSQVLSTARLDACCH